MQEKIYPLIIIGSGPAGLTAAIYAARANLKPLVLTGRQPGGQLTLTSLVENFPGFPKGILGQELMQAMRKQAQNFNAEIIDQSAQAVDFKKTPYQIKTQSQNYLAHSVIIATGASARWLGLDSEQALIGKGVSGCATCDGFFFKNKTVAVVGGGDAALEEAIFLTKFAKKVTVIHRRDKLRACQIMQKRAQANPKIDFLWNSEAQEVLGKDKVEGIVVLNNKTKQKNNLTLEGLFVAIGHKPNTEIFAGQLELDEKKYLKVTTFTHSSRPGIFVAGDVQDYRYRQAVTAAGAGCMAAIDAEKWLTENKLIEERASSTSYGR